MLRRVVLILVCSFHVAYIVNIKQHCFCTNIHHTLVLFGTLCDVNV